MPTAPSCWPTAAPTSSKSNHQRVIRCDDGRPRAPSSRPAVTAHCSAFWPGQSTAWSPIPTVDDDVELTHRLLAAADAVVWSAGSKVAEGPGLYTRRDPPPPSSPDRHVDHPVRTGGPWRDRAATEFTLQAWSGGIVGLGRGQPDRAPVFVGGQVGEYLAGAYASAATWRRGTAGAAVARGNFSTCRCWKHRFFV